MKKSILAGLVMASMAGMASAADVSLSLDAASAYVFRGVTFNDGLVLQPGMEATGLGDLTVGVWGNLDLDDYDDTLQDGQFSEIDIYALYDLKLSDEKSGITLGYTEYAYPSGGGDADREVGLTFSYDVICQPFISAYYGLDGGIDKSWYFEAGVGHEMALDEAEAWTLGVSALIGYLDPDDGESGFHQYELGASLAWKSLYASVTYIGQADKDVLVDVEDGGGYDVNVVGMLGVSYHF